MLTQLKFVWTSFNKMANQLHVRQDLCIYLKLTFEMKAEQKWIDTSALSCKYESTLHKLQCFHGLITLAK